MSRERFANLPQPCVYLIATAALCRRPLLETVALALDAGASVVQMREKALPWPRARERALALRNLCVDRGALFVVNDDPRLAKVVDADGLHVGQDDLAPRLARAVVGDAMAIGLSTHDDGQLEMARADPDVDVVGIGPIFSTRTKAAGTPIGVAIAARAVAALEPDRATFAIGGIDEKGARLLGRAGCRRVAVGSAVLAAADPGDAVRRLLAGLAQPPQV